MRVLGIDPSVQSTGYGVIEYSGNSYSVLEYGEIKPSRQLLFLHKINMIRNRLEEIIRTHKPEEVAIENPFYAQNIKTAITLGQVRGAVLVAVASQNCPLHEYSALEIKKAVTGYGRADKDQVITMIKILLDLQGEAMGSDAADALAAAFCHLNTRMFQQQVNEAGKKRSKT
jgi:crossover junction endodeoxyribonuclease RuvC